MNTDPFLQGLSLLFCCYNYLVNKSEVVVRGGLVLHCMHKDEHGGMSLVGIEYIAKIINFVFYR